MANPAATFYNITAGIGVNAQVPGADFEGDAEITFAGATYVTNGMTVASLTAALPLSLVTHFTPLCLGPTLDATVNDFSFDRANGKVKLYAGTVEVGNGQALDAYKLYARVRGRR